MTVSLPSPSSRTEGQALAQWASDTFGPRLALACSAGVEDCVLVHMASLTGQPIRVFMLDTGRLHPQTHEAFERLRRAYPGLRFEVYAPQTKAVEALASQQGLFGFRENLEARHACCHVRKVEPLARALAGAEAWLTGLRREQGPTRRDLAAVQSDGGSPERLKIAPLLDWDEAHVWAYARAHQVPTHPLHGEGYPSIGCAPCTRAIQPGEDPRAGRWWWERPEHKECGLHSAPWRNQP